MFGAVYLEAFLNAITVTVGFAPGCYSRERTLPFFLSFKSHASPSLLTSNLRYLQPLMLPLFSRSLACPIVPFSRYEIQLPLPAEFNPSGTVFTSSACKTTELYKTPVRAVLFACLVNRIAFSRVLYSAVSKFYQISHSLEISTGCSGVPRLFAKLRISSHRRNSLQVFIAIV